MVLSESTWMALWYRFFNSCAIDSNGRRLFQQIFMVQDPGKYAGLPSHWEVEMYLLLEVGHCGMFFYLVY